MGANCCKVTKDKSVASGPQVEVSQFRNVRHSPQWGFRWDNRTHIEDIMDTSSSASQPDIANFNGSEMKRMPTPDRRVSSSGSSPSGKNKANRSSTSTPQLELSTSSQKSPTQSYKPAFTSVLSSNSKPQSQPFDNTSSGKSPVSGNKSASHQIIPHPPFDNTSSSFNVPSTVAAPTFSPSGYRTRSLPSSTTFTSSKPSISQISRQASGNNYSYPASFDHDTNHWTFHTFTELVASSQRAQPFVSVDSCRFIHAESRGSNSDPNLTPSNIEVCNICTKPLKERSPHGTQKLYSNELPVTAVLDCGHVFHADCLEKLTPDLSRYDPECPRCTYGAKDLNRLIWNLGNGDKINKITKKQFDKLRSGSVKGSLGRPFLKRNISEGESSRKKGLFARFRG